MGPGNGLPLHTLGMGPRQNSRDMSPERRHNMVSYHRSADVFGSHHNPIFPSFTDFAGLLVLQVVFG